MCYQGLLSGVSQRPSSTMIKSLSVGVFGPIEEGNPSGHASGAGGAVRADGAAGRDSGAGEMKRTDSALNISMNDYMDRLDYSVYLY